MKETFEMIHLPTVVQLEDYNDKEIILKVCNYLDIFADSLKDVLKTPIKKLVNIIKNSQNPDEKPFYLTKDKHMHFAFYRKKGGIYWNAEVIEKLPPENNSIFLSSFLYTLGLSLSDQKKEISESEIFAAGNIWSSILFVYFGYEYGIKLDIQKTELFSALIKLYTYHNYTKNKNMNEFLKFIIARSDYKILKPSDVKMNADSFVSVKSFLETLEKNELVDGLNVPRYASKLLNNIGIMGLKAFESYEYFVPWILAAAIPNKYISSNLFRNNRGSFNRLIEIYLNSLNRINMSKIIRK